MFQDKTWIKMPKWTFFLKYHFSGNTSALQCLCLYYWDYLKNFWRNNWRSIIDVIERLGHTYLSFLLILFFREIILSLSCPQALLTSSICSSFCLSCSIRVCKSTSANGINRVNNNQASIILMLEVLGNLKMGNWNWKI